MRRAVLPIVLPAVVVALAAQARAGDEYLGKLATDVRTRLDALVAAKTPKIVPPKPIAVTWKVTKIGSIDLGAPLVALTAAELDGDRRSGEVYAVTAREVIAIGFRHGRLVELGRVAFQGELAVPAPRDVVGTAVVEGAEVVASASPWAKDLRVTWQGKQLIGQSGSAGFLVCPGERIQLASGRNHFHHGVVNVRCRNDLVDRAGYPLRVRAELAMNHRLSVTMKRCPPDQSPGSPARPRKTDPPCEDAGKYEISKVGTAFEIADVDRDGAPEVIVSEASPPFADDSARVITLGTDEKKGLFKKIFRGGVAGLVTVDGDDPDDIAEVVAAVRFTGASRVDLWRLD